MSEPSTVRADPSTARHVVVASDGSAGAFGAAAAAGALFESADRFEIVTVIPPPLEPADDATGFAGPTFDVEEVARVNHERRVEGDGIAAATGRHLGPQPADMQVLMGDPADALLAHVSDVRPDVLVAGASGHGRSAGAVLGSIAWKLVAGASCPVILVPRSVGEASRDVRRPVDGDAGGPNR